MFNAISHDSEISSFRWTPMCRRRFLLILAQIGSVNRACQAVSKSRKSAYALLRKNRGRPFAAAWDAALIHAHGRIEGQMLEYAFGTIEAEGHRHPQTGRLMWRHTDPLLGAGMGMAHLDRLDKAVAKISLDPARDQAARNMLEEWPECLDALLGLQPETCYLAPNSVTSHLQAAHDHAMSDPHLFKVQNHG
jgi:hypothetical protein